MTTKEPVNGRPASAHERDFMRLRDELLAEARAPQDPHLARSLRGVAGSLKRRHLT
jgi:hypothetical protein